ncbi:hypothetical protein F5Y17DRAFT_461358 [Xylariaceae sp. FL0594]|nr:hypothetical protein F5Y17DRAFT_461358 [Xylariaceae sp. FL0594]
MAAPPSPLPEYVYKIIPAAPPSPIPAAYPLSDLDQKDGFVHLSIASQIPITADLFFTQHTSIHVLKLRFKPAFHPITNWDTPGCPHLYGNFGSEDVVDVKEFVRSGGGEESWKEAMARQEAGFLV